MPKKKDNSTKASTVKNRFSRLPIKGEKAMRGQPLYYDELKKSLNLKLTPTAKKILSELAKKTNLSRSEFQERLLRQVGNDEALFDDVVNLVNQFSTDISR